MPPLIIAQRTIQAPITTAQCIQGKVVEINQHTAKYSQRSTAWVTRVERQSSGSSDGQMGAEMHAIAFGMGE
jgi:hypothetical protein